MAESESNSKSPFNGASAENVLHPHQLDNSVKFGVVTDDGRTISAHFGHAPYYQAYEIQDGAVKRKELRPKPGHQPGEAHHHMSIPRMLMTPEGFQGFLKKAGLGRKNGKGR